MALSNIQQAAKAVKNGWLVVYPTDTLYALGASIFNVDAVQHVFEVKNRPLNIPLPVAVESIDQIGIIAEFNSNASALANHFLPGNLTLILPKKSVVSSVITAKKNSIAVRIPADETALCLLSLTGPLTVTSANIHQRKTPETVRQIKNMFNTELIAFYLDEGRRSAIPSTIVDLTQSSPCIVREGEITADEINSVIHS